MKFGEKETSYFVGPLYVVGIPNTHTTVLNKSRIKSSNCT